MSSPRLSSPNLLGAACGLVFLAACTSTPSPTPTPVGTSPVASPTSALSRTTELVPSVTPVPVTTLVALPTLATPIQDSGTPYVAPTATPPPFSVIPVATSSSQPGVVEEWAFANSSDLLAARVAYETYFKFMSFHDSPPVTSTELTAQASQLRDLNPNPGLNAFLNGVPCSFEDALAVIGKAQQSGQYYRINAGPLQWNETAIYLRLEPVGVVIHMEWTSHAVVQLVDRSLSKVVREKQMDLLGNASVTIKGSHWTVAGESGGFYCYSVQLFNR